MPGFLLLTNQINDNKFKERIGRYPEEAATHRSAVPSNEITMEVVMKKLTQERLKELLHYDPKTGAFVWRHRILSQGRISRLSGKVAGSVNKATGYRQIGIDGKRYYASRLAWLYMEGYSPEREVDHRDRIRHNDKWKNLRHVSHQCNLRNCKLSKNNKTGITGVIPTPSGKKFEAYITVGEKLIRLGRFATKLDAARARWNAEVKHGFPNCNTTSTAYLYLKSVEFVN